MSSKPSREYLRLIDHQDGVLAIGQAVNVGMTAEWIRNQVRSGHWKVLHRGVYAAFTGTASRRAELWGALLRAGPDAVLSHQTAGDRNVPIFPGRKGFGVGVGVAFELDVDLEFDVVFEAGVIGSR
jgi:hypothetical protein